MLHRKRAAANLMQRLAATGLSAIVAAAAQAQTLEEIIVTADALLHDSGKLKRNGEFKALRTALSRS